MKIGIDDFDIQAQCDEQSDDEYLAWLEQQTFQEHDPDKCGCRYLGNDMWSCGHIDNA